MARSTWRRVPMKVCFILTRYHPVFAGHAVQLEQIFSRLKERGVEPEVWTLQYGESPARDAWQGVPVRRFGPAGDSRSARYRRISSLMAAVFFEGRRYAVLHWGGLDSATRWALLPAALTGAKSVVQMTLLGSDDP